MSEKIVGTADPKTDVANLERAITNQREVTLVGTFDLGSDDATRRTITISNGIRLRGVVETTSLGSRHYRTVIRGGGALLKHALYGDSHSGAFKVTSGEAVAIEDISFVGARGPAIFAERCAGLTVKRCRFVDPVPGWMLGLAAATPDTARPEGPNIRFVSAIWAAGPECRGAFLAYRNIYKAAAPVGDDDTIIACGETSFDDIKIVSNELHCHDEAIEVLANLSGGGAGSAIVIADNQITMRKLVGDYFGRRGHGAIVCVRNGHDRTTINNNRIRSTGNVAPFLLTGANFDIFDNTTIQEPGPSTDQVPRADATYMLGVNVAPLNLTASALERLGLADLGPSLDSSDVWNNTLIGSAVVAFQMADYGGPTPNTSHGNRFWDNHLLLSYDRALELGAGTHGNEFAGSFREPHDLAPPGSNVIISSGSTEPRSVPRMVHRLRDALGTLRPDGGAPRSRLGGVVRRIASGLRGSRSGTRPSSGG